MVKFISSENLDAITFKNFQNLGFSGTIIFRDLNGKPTKTEVYKDGLKSEKFKNFAINNGSKTAPVDECLDGCWIMMFTRPTIDWYNNSGAGGAWEYSYSGLGATQSEWVHVSGSGYTSNSSTNPYHNHYDYPNGPSVGSDNHPVEVIIGDNVTPCVTNIITKLTEKDTYYSVIPDISTGEGASHIIQQILDMFNNSDQFGLTIDVAQLGTNSEGYQINGQTTTNDSGWDINLDSDLVTQGTQLSIAKTIIHEAIHTFILKTLQKNRSSEMTQDLNSLWQKFENEDDQFNLTQHEFMAQYVDAFSLSLAAWDNHQQSPEYYKMLSWGGLESSSTYQNLNNQTEIQITIQNERFNRKGAKSTPCN